MSEQDFVFMREALNLARQGIEERHGGPFGAVVVFEGKIIGRGWNQVVLKSDPTAHAEIFAIRDACHRLGHFHLHGATLYTSCEPCPMCLSAAYWARLQAIVYAADANDAAAAGFNDKRIKQSLQRPFTQGTIKTCQLMQSEAVELFHQWQQDPDKTDY